MADPSLRDKVFFSYSRKDRKWLEMFQTTLKPLIRANQISVWDDTKIKAGDIWRDEIKQAIASARVAVLLVSTNFLNSDFIAENELPPLLEAAQNEGLRILLVIVGHSLFEETEIGRYQAINDPSRPLANLSAANREKEIVRICKEIKSAVAEEGEAEPTQTKPTHRPDFKITVPVTSLAGLVRLDVNILRMAKPDEGGTLFPILVEFENLPKEDGSFHEVKDVWAQIIYRDFDFLGAELARASSGCWIDQPIPDILFPLRTPRYLMLGGWHLTKGEDPPNELRIFEYSRELHRATEKEVKIAGPRKILIDKRRIVVDVVLTSNGHHGVSCAYQFQLSIFGPCGFSINCVKRP